MTKPLTKAIRDKQATGTAVIVPYIMAGDGGLENLETKLQLLEASGATAIEVGVPFSDPVADGPVIQSAGLRALQDAVSLRAILDNLQNSRVKLPLVIMSYINPIFKYGIKEFIQAIQTTPVKGLIVPDLPYEHRELISNLLADTDIALVPLVSLTSSEARMKEIASEAEGFIYAVTVNGITGQRQAFANTLETHFAQLKRVSPVPVLAGFGISTQAHVAHFHAICDGVVIGSKFVQLFHENKEQEVQKFLEEATK